MNLDGSAVLHASPEEVWAVITDPAVLARTIPGCESLRRVGDHRPLHLPIAVQHRRAVEVHAIAPVSPRRAAAAVITAVGDRTRS